MRDEYYVLAAAAGYGACAYVFSMWADTALFPKTFAVMGMGVLVEPACNAFEVMMFLVGVGFGLLGMMTIKAYRDYQKRRTEKNGRKA